MRRPVGAARRYESRLLAIALVLLLGTHSTRAAFTPTSPEVRACVEKAVAFLDKGPRDNRLGARAIVGLTLVKEGRDRADPLIQGAVEAIQKQIQGGLGQIDIYSLGLSVIFLAELDSKYYSAEINSLLDELANDQQTSGGWGYPSRQTGDTSMTQYGVLSLWTADQRGAPTATESWERVGKWLMRTQDPSGAFGYQGTDPGSYQLVPQQEVRHSMVAAGLGSLYVISHRITAATNAKAEEAAPSDVLRRIGGPQPRRTGTVSLERRILSAALDRGDRWMAENYKIDPPEYTHYYLYAFERYQSFREVVTGKKFAHLDWYDDGVRFLAKTQRSDGSWTGATGEETDTAFATLFLLRSSSQSLEHAPEFGAGTLVGGRGLPEGDELELRAGRLVQRPLAGPADELLAIIEDPRHPDFRQALQGVEDLALGEDPVEVERQAQQLRKLALGETSEAKLVALQALARRRNLDDVPTMIESLEDEDPRVFEAADEALRFVSRRLTDDRPQDATPTVRRETIAKWRAWYRSIRPETGG